MSDCNIPIQEIFDTECIGESLPKINTNFLELSSSICSLSSTLVQALDGTVKSIGVVGGSTGLTTLNSPVTGIGTIAIDGILNLAHGGTGADASDASGKEQARQNLGIGNVSIHNSPLPINFGGTGATSADQARQNLGINSANSISEGQIAIQNGGTGADNPATARQNLGMNDANNINAGVLGTSYGGIGTQITTTSGRAQARQNLGLGTISVHNSPLPINHGGTGAVSVIESTVFAGPVSPSGGQVSIGQGSPSFRFLDARDIPNLPASKILPNSGVLPTSVIPILPASNIGSGTLNINQIPNLPASKITSEVLSTAVGGTGANIVIANHFLGGPSSGSQALPVFRTLVAADIPNISADKITTGVLLVSSGGTGKANVNSKQVFIGPAGGSATAPTFRELVSGDIPQRLQLTSLGIGTAALTTTGSIQTTGNIQTTGDVIAFSTSDERLKENIKPIEDALEKVSKISGVTFDWSEEFLKDNGGADGYFIRKNDVGVIAQEIQKVLPEIVAKKQDGLLAVKYDRICVLLIEAVKELNKKQNQVHPVGAVQTFINKSAPIGWLLCNGETIPNYTGSVQNQLADYSKLYEVLEESGYKEGKLPDIQDEKLTYCIKY